MTETDEKKSVLSGVFVPACVIRCKSLTPIEQLFLSKIKDLSAEKGYCYASNNFFGDFFGMSAGRASQIVARLSEMQFIASEIDGGNGSRYSRKIFLTNVSAPLFDGTKYIEAITTVQS